MIYYIWAKKQTDSPIYWYWGKYNTPNIGSATFYKSIETAKKFGPNSKNGWELWEVPIYPTLKVQL